MTVITSNENVKSVKEITKQMTHWIEQIQNLMEANPSVKAKLESQNQFLVHAVIEMNYQLCDLLVLDYTPKAQKTNK